METPGGGSAGERNAGGIARPSTPRPDLHRPASRGFDFLGYLFTPKGIEVAPRAVERCVVRMSRLYEQGVDLVRIGACARRWQRWARSGLQALGEELSERAYELACGSLGGHGLPIGTCCRGSRRLRNLP